MRLTIERIRSLVLAAGVLLLLAIAAFLAIGKWKNPLNRRDIPKRLGIDIQQEANGVTYTQAHGGHTIFKIHAARVVQLRNSHATLHNVEIDLYGRSVSGPDRVVDRIQGNEFDYDQKSGTATAAGPVEITMERPAPAQQQPPGQKPSAAGTNAPQADQAGEILVKTSGLVFNQQSGMMTTAQRVEFTTAQASGSSVGASYDTDRAYLVLDRDVELTAHPAAPPGHTPAPSVEVRARHAEFDRDAQICYLTDATAATRGEQATAAQAQVVFRDNGTVMSLSVSQGFTASTAAGNRLAAPTGAMQFNGNNQPRSAHLEGGVKLSSAGPGRTLSGAAPTMDLTFSAGGELRHAHLQRGVEMLDQEERNGPPALTTTRTWRSPVADVDFRSAARARVEPATVFGSGGVVVSAESRRGSQPPVPSELAADQLTGQFGPDSALTALTGVGHARLRQTSASGARQDAAGDRLQVSFLPAAERQTPGAANTPAQDAALAPGGAQIQTAELDGQVSLLQEPAGKPGSPPEPPLRATAGHALYESAGQWLHLTVHPQISQGAMDVAAEKIDVSQASGDAFAHGDVKATWIDSNEAASAGQPANPISLGGHGPAHAIAAEAEFHQVTGQATFRGHARLWQLENSVAGPVIVVDRQKQTLAATTASPADPVVVVLLNASEGARAPAAHQPAAGPAVIRARGGSLLYSGIEHKALLKASPLAAVMAQSDDAQCSSDQVELFLAPAGATRAPGNAAAPAAVERMVAAGHVVLTSQGRRGTGSQLAYSARAGQYILTGTASAPPRMSDPQRGSVTGNALIFNSRDDSVSIEGGGRETITQTTLPNNRH